MHPPVWKASFSAKKTFINADLWTLFFEFWTDIFDTTFFVTSCRPPGTFFVVSVFTRVNGHLFCRILSKSVVSPQNKVQSIKGLMMRFQNPINKHYTNFQTVKRKIKPRNGWKHFGLGYIPGFDARFSKNCRTVAKSTPMTDDHENRWGSSN